MPLDLDSALGVHAKALAVRSQRAEILAANLANADTPNYKARDIDFKAALDRVHGEAPSLTTTRKNHIPSEADEPGEGVVFFRTPMQPSLDGNTVDTQIEQAEFARNAVLQQSSMTFLSGRIKSLLLALRGE